MQCAVLLHVDATIKQIKTEHLQNFLFCRVWIACIFS